MLRLKTNDLRIHLLLIWLIVQKLEHLQKIDFKLGL